eukprot:jgi/Chlat1/4376/Chrsp29S04518
MGEELASVAMGETAQKYVLELKQRMHRRWALARGQIVALPSVQQQIRRRAARRMAVAAAAHARFKGNVVAARWLKTLDRLDLPRVAALFSGSLAPTLAAATSSAKQLSVQPLPSLEVRLVESDGAMVSGQSADGESLLTHAAQTVTLAVVGTASRLFMHGLNDTRVYAAEKLEAVVRHRKEGQGLVTVSNHVASMDDPLVLASALPASVLLDRHLVRWTLCATDRCFKNPVMSAFFRAGKVLPVERGAGINQQGMQVATDKLRRGEWVHIFPEGSRSRNGGRVLGPMRRGVGKLVAEGGDQVPLVVPLVHTGMERVIPVGKKLPAVGQQVSVLIGDPVPVEDLVEDFRNNKLSDKELYTAIAFRVGEALSALKLELEHKEGLVEQQPEQAFLVASEEADLDDEFPFSQKWASSQGVFIRTVTAARAAVGHFAESYRPQALFGFAASAVPFSKLPSSDGHNLVDWVRTRSQLLQAAK